MIMYRDEQSQTLILTPVNIRVEKMQFTNNVPCINCFEDTDNIQRIKVFTRARFFHHIASRAD